jgi:methionine-rich copper-binding protein CopC
MSGELGFDGLRVTGGPRVTIEQAPAQADPAARAPILFRVVFSESVSDFSSAAVTVTGGTVQSVQELAPHNGTTYEVAVGGMVGDGAVTATVPAGVAHNATGQASEASVSVDNRVQYDLSAPRLTQVSIRSDNRYADYARAGHVVTLHFRANEALGGKPAVRLHGSAVPPVYDPASDLWTCSRRLRAGEAEGQVTFTIDFADAVGNPGATVSSTTDASRVVVDETRPTVVAVSSPAADGRYTLEDLLEITVTFTETVVVDTTAGTPLLQLALYPGAVAALYLPAATGADSSASTTLSFAHLVQWGESTAHLDCTGPEALLLNGSLITDLAGNAAVLTLPAPGAAGSLGANRTLGIVTSGTKYELTDIGALSPPRPKWYRY